MKRICLGCCNEIKDEINENYNGLAIHYGQDWYCGPVVSVADEVFEATLLQIRSDRKTHEYYAEIASRHPEDFE